MVDERIDLFRNFIFLSVLALSSRFDGPSG